MDGIGGSGNAGFVYWATVTFKQPRLRTDSAVSGSPFQYNNFTVTYCHVHISIIQCSGVIIMYC